jgi:hypothetical protein
VAVRALVRSPGKAGHLADDGVERVAGSLAEIAGWQHSIAGCDARIRFSRSGSGPDNAVFRFGTGVAGICMGIDIGCAQSHLVAAECSRSRSPPWSLAGYRTPPVDRALRAVKRARS